MAGVEAAIKPVGAATVATALNGAQAAPAVVEALVVDAVPQAAIPQTRWELETVAFMAAVAAEVEEVQLLAVRAARRELYEFAMCREAWVPSVWKIRILV